MKNQSKWKPITEEITRKVLVTNNLKAMDSSGQMSHVWMAEYVHSGPYKGLSGRIEDRGEYWTLSGPMNLTHYCEIPQYHPLRVRQKEAREQKLLREKQGRP